MSTNPHSLFRTLLLGACLLLLQSAMAAESTPSALPSPDLKQLEPAVREQLQFSRNKLEAQLKQKATDPAQLAALHADLAMLYHAYGFNEAAEDTYLRALELTPRDPRLSYYLAYLYEQTGRLPEAAQRYQYCLRLAPGELPALLRLAQVHTRLNQTEQAGLVLTLALQLHKGQPSLLAALGEQALAEKHYADAIELLETVLKQVPAANRLHYPLAMAYRAQGNTEKAKQHLSLHGAVGIQANDPLLAELEDLKQGERIHLLRGKRAFAAGDYATATKAFRQAITAKPDSARAHVNLGTALMQSGDRPAAVAAYQQALKLAPDNATAHFNLGVLLSQSGQLVNAAEHIEHSLTGSPKDSEAHFYLAELYRALGDTEQAASHYRSTVVIDKQHAAGWLNGIDLLLKTGQYEKAQLIAEQAYKALPNDGRVVHALARLLASNPILSLRDGGRAVELASKVYQARPSATHAETLAMAHAQNGRCEEAVKSQQQAIDSVQDESQQDQLARMQRLIGYYRQQRPCAAPGQPNDKPTAVPAG